jgi:hypothetical protein
MYIILGCEPKINFIDTSHIYSKMCLFSSRKKNSFHLILIVAQLDVRYHLLESQSRSFSKNKIFEPNRIRDQVFFVWWDYTIAFHILLTYSRRNECAFEKNKNSKVWRRARRLFYSRIFIPYGKRTTAMTTEYIIKLYAAFVLVCACSI